LIKILKDILRKNLLKTALISRKKALKNFLCLLPNGLEGKLELWLKDERKEKSIYANYEATDVLDALQALEYSLGDNISDLNACLMEIYDQLLTKYPSNSLKINEIATFLMKCKACGPIIKKLTVRHILINLRVRQSTGN